MRHDALKVTAYFDEGARSEGHLLADTLAALYEKEQIEASILLRGAEGFGIKHLLRTDRFADIALNLPLISIAVDRREQIERLLPQIQKHLVSGLVTVERATLPDTSLPLEVLSNVVPDQETRLSIYVGRRQRDAQGTLAYRHTVDILDAADVSGATVLLGLDGMIHGRRERAHFFSRNRRVPIIIVSIGARERIVAALAEIEAALPASPITLERVEVCKRDGHLLREPTPLTVNADDTPDCWHKITVYAATDAHHKHRPLGTELIRQLYRANASGATLTRGIWGFSGDHQPHGERWYSIGRHSPVVITTVCPPQELQRIWPIIDSATSTHGLVTNEIIPTLHAVSPNLQVGNMRLASSPSTLNSAAP